MIYHKPSLDKQRCAAPTARSYEKNHNNNNNNKEISERKRLNNKKHAE